MRLFTFVCLLLMFVHSLNAQVPEIPPTTSTTEQQLENITENSEDAETEDDAYQQQMLQFQRNAINLNTADENQLQELRLLTPMQITSFISYRTLLGKLISIYELQSIPSWDILTIQKLRPFVRLSQDVNGFENMGSHLLGGDHTVLLRVSQTLEKSKGYTTDPSTGKSAYPGSPQRLFVRYRYSFKNVLQYGLVGEKDAGEQFFKGAQKHGFDFYAAHIFIRNMGWIKSLALGDFTVNMGQGLIQWMSLAYKKGPEILSVKRQSTVLRPYNSSGEILFHRGAGITVGRNNWQATLFGSYRKLDGNLKADTSATGLESISSLQTSGLHRTTAEVADKKAQGQLAYGGNFSYRFGQLRVALNAIQYKMKHPIIKADQPYNLFALSGNGFRNYSADYSYTFKNMHVFGEAAISARGYPAMLNGMLLSVANTVDLSFLYRNISKGYQALNANSFTESVTPTNETGLFTGLTVRPNSFWLITAFADVYRFPWLKFRVNAPSQGRDLMLQITYRPHRELEIYSRFKSEIKPLNEHGALAVLNPSSSRHKSTWRTHLAFRLNSACIFRSRVELSWFNHARQMKEEGFLFYTDLIYKPMLKRLSGNLRVQYFETGGYDSRLYAYENDVLYSFSIPVFYGKGYRYYININYDLTKKISSWVRFAQSIYTGGTELGSGLDNITRNTKTELRLQLLYKF